MHIILYLSFTVAGGKINILIQYFVVACDREKAPGFKEMRVHRLMLYLEAQVRFNLSKKSH